MDQGSHRPVTAQAKGATPPLVRFEGVSKHFGEVTAVDCVSLDIAEGEFFALLGPSGCGKTTLMRMLAGFVAPDAGRVLLNGADIAGLPPHRRPSSMMFQTYALFPHLTVEKNIGFGLRQQGWDRDRSAARVEEMLSLVRLEGLNRRKPDQLSGGQKQRVIIARALTLRPKLIVCDEVVAALDMSIRGDVLNLFAELQRDLGLTYVFITHDLSVVSHISERIAVMYLGRFVELGPTDEIAERPLHPYTQALLSAEPLPLPSTMRSDRRIILQGEIPSPIDPPSGCRFRTRCQYAQSRCAEQTPDWCELARDHWVACHFADRANFSPDQSSSMEDMS